MNAKPGKGDDLEARTYAFDLRVILPWRALPHREDAHVLGKQLLRCGTSAGTNDRSACLEKSPKDFLNKGRICLEEADKSCY